MSGARPIRVYPLPPVLENNPYLRLLYENVARAGGIDVHHERPVPRGLLALALARGPRVLHLHFFDELLQRPGRASTWLRTGAFWLLLRGLRLAGVRLVWTVHNVTPHTLHHAAPARWLYRRLLRAAEARLILDAAGIPAVHAAYASDAPFIPIAHGHLIDVDGPPPAATPAAARAVARQQLALPTEPIIVLALGAIRPYKRLEQLIDAFVTAAPAAARLLIAGPAPDGAYLARLRQRADDQVLFRPGRIADDRMPLFAAAADIVAVPYDFFIASSVLIWALSHGKPVVAPAYPTVTPLVAAERTGFLYTPEDGEAALGQALRRAVHAAATPAWREETATTARARMQTRDWAAIGRATADVYRQVTT